MDRPLHLDDPEAIARDVRTVGRIGAVPTLLRVICETTGMGFSAVARVTEGTWTVCAVDDGLDFGLAPGGQLEVNTTLCKEARAARAPVFFDQASLSDTYRDHPTPRLYNIESYISVPVILPDGEYFGNLCAIDPKPARTSDPKIVSMFIRFAELIAIEISNERASAAQLGELLEERSTGTLREQFVAILGHDLRTPLSSIALSAEYLLAPEVGTPPSARPAVERIVRSTRRMAGLIDDILDFARGRLGGGFAVVKREVADVGEAFRQAVAEFEQAHPEREFVLDIVAPSAMLCDRGRLQQLVSNLVANAIAHGAPDRPIRVSATAGEGSITLTVRNEGEPIPPEQRSALFKPFSRRAADHGRSHDGLGLGLFICAEIVRAHGGQIEVISSPEAGTIFAARLPVDTGPAPL